MGLNGRMHTNEFHIRHSKFNNLTIILNSELSALLNAYLALLSSLAEE